MIRPEMARPGSRVPRRTILSAFLPVVIAVSGCGSTKAPQPVPTNARTLRLAPQTLRVGGAPVAIAAGAGAIWVADNTGGLVLRLDPRSGRQIGKPARVGAGPLAITAGPGGAWVATGAGTVEHLDPGTGAPDGPPVTVADPNGIATGGGSVWVTNRQASTVTRIDERTRRVVGAAIRVGRTPADIVAGFGSIWIANVDDGTVSRLDERTGKPIGGPIPVADAQVLALAVDRDGVWVASTDIRIGERVHVRRLDPRSGQFDDVRAAIPAGVPADLAAGLGRIWLTDTGTVLPGRRRTAAVRPLAPGSETSQAGVRVGDDPRGIALSADAVWTANAGDGTVTRIAVGSP